MFSSLVNFLLGTNATDSTTSTSGNKNEEDFKNRTTNSIETTGVGRLEPDSKSVSNNPIDERRHPLIANDTIYEDILDGDWLLIDKEEDEEDSLPRTDSEEELPFVEIKRSPNFQQRQRNCNHHSLSAYHQRRLALRYDDGILAQSVYVVPSTFEGIGDGGNRNGSSAPTSMEDSWFLTPPPCFTSTGPVNMETSPLENLLIEHPSMSVYHSIRPIQTVTESFFDIDLATESLDDESNTEIVEQSPVQIQPTPRRQERRHRDQNLERVENKMEYLVRASQKSYEKRMRETVCRGSIKRANKVRDYNSKGNRYRRSDMQNCRIVSGANNNRKC